jgi:ADP-ribosylglycohydrolase/DNA-binding transcriptional regulator YhcF (GntR family)
VKPVTKRTLASLVAEQIKSDIVQGNLQASHKLPSEVELCATLHVGRPTLREALRILEGQGWIQLKFSAGAYVADPEAVADRMAAHYSRESLLDFAGLELQQLRDEGRAISDSVRDELQHLKESGTIRQIEDFFERLELLPAAPDFPNVEPDLLPEIQAESPAGTSGPGPQAVPREEVRARIRGGLLGRCIGVRMGTPLQGWSEDAVEQYLRAAGFYPLSGYLPENIGEAPQGEYTLFTEPRQGPESGPKAPHRNAEDGEPLLGHTALSLKTLRRRGFEFTTEDVAEDWLHSLPYEQNLTAERQAYANLVRGISPPATAKYFNPFREWIGALVRADAYGYVCPGDPGRAAALAYRDARLSHTKNGIYGAMFVAAAIAASFVEDSATAIVESGLARIPRHSRMAELIGTILGAAHDGVDWKTTLKKAGGLCRGYRRPHVLPNTARLVVGLLFGDMRFRETVCLTVMAGGDPDCTGAAAGSIAGVHATPDQLPADLVKPVGISLITPVLGYNDVTLDTVAKQFYALAADFYYR